MPSFFAVATIALLGTGRPASPAQISVRRNPVQDLVERLLEAGEPEHGHSELDAEDYAHLDVHTPTITGGLRQSQQSPELLGAANRAMAKWWTATPVGRRFVLVYFLSDVRRNRK
jgi:hypothetical protein